MAIISANVQYNRGEHKLLDFSSYQQNYNIATGWVADDDANAAVGQYIYIGGQDDNKGPYIVENIVENGEKVRVLNKLATIKDIDEQVKSINIPSKLSDLTDDLLYGKVVVSTGQTEEQNPDFYVQNFNSFELVSISGEVETDVTRFVFKKDGGYIVSGRDEDVKDSYRIVINSDLDKFAKKTDIPTLPENILTYNENYVVSPKTLKFGGDGNVEDGKEGPLTSTLFDIDTEKIVITTSSHTDNSTIVNTLNLNQDNGETSLINESGSDIKKIQLSQSGVTILSQLEGDKSSTLILSNDKASLESDHIIIGPSENDSKKIVFTNGEVYIKKDDGGNYDAVNKILVKGDIDKELNDKSEYPVQNKAVYNKFTEVGNRFTEVDERITNIIAGDLSDALTQYAKKDELIKINDNPLIGSGETIYVINDIQENFTNRGTTGLTFVSTGTTGNTRTAIINIGDISSYGTGITEYDGFCYVSDVANIIREQQDQIKELQNQIISLSERLTNIENNYINEIIPTDEDIDVTKSGNTATISLNGITN